MTCGWSANEKLRIDKFRIARHSEKAKSKVGRARSSSRSCCLEEQSFGGVFGVYHQYLYHPFVYCCYFTASPDSLCFGPNVEPKKSPLFQAGG